MTATSTNTAQAVAEWMKIFPKQTTENYTSSVTFIKQLTVVAVSTMTYLKNVFPEDSFKVESFGGLKLRILKKNCKDDMAQFLSTALTQAFDAFDKKYLHQLALCFYENECKLENLIEYHIFEYTYTNAGVTMNVHSKSRDSEKKSVKYTFENVREKTIQLIRACVVIMQSCQNELPPEYDVSLRLYYNENAPPDYQAPGYSGTEDDQDHLEPTLAEAVKLGTVETNFHRLTARTYIKEHFFPSHEALPSSEPPKMSIEVDDLSEKSTSGSSLRINCPCGKYNDTDSYSSSELLTCVYCQSRQHAACFGVSREAVAAARGRGHCCARCHDADPARPPTDTHMAALSHKNREALCLFRRTLDWCTQTSSINTQSLMDKFRISEPNATRLMKVLHSVEIIQREPESVIEPQKILADKLKSTINKYYNLQDDCIVDRLMAESVASQESQSDPVGNVLSPLEKVSLHSASNISRVIETSPTAKPINEDPSLKDYREAISMSISEDVVPPLVQKINKRKLDNNYNLGLRTGVRNKKAKVLPKE